MGFLACASLVSFFCWASAFSMSMPDCLRASSRTDAVAAANVDGEQRGGELVDAAGELAPAPAHVLLAKDHGLAIAACRHRAGEKGRDGELEQGRGGGVQQPVGLGLEHRARGCGSVHR
jgi:hypothetical protein